MRLSRASTDVGGCRLVARLNFRRSESGVARYAGGRHSTRQDPKCQHTTDARGRAQHAKASWRCNTSAVRLPVTVTRPRGPVPSKRELSRSWVREPTGLGYRSSNRPSAGSHADPRYGTRRRPTVTARSFPSQLRRAERRPATIARRGRLLGQVGCGARNQQYLAFIWSAAWRDDLQFSAAHETAP
jgi:hypothetical protein